MNSANCKFNWHFAGATLAFIAFWLAAIVIATRIVSGSGPCIEDRLAHLEARVDNVAGLVLEQPVQVESRYTASHLMWLLARELESNGVDVVVHVGGEE